MNYLPGLAPSFVRLEVSQTDSGWLVEALAADDARYLSKAADGQQVVCESWGEVLVALAAILDAFGL